MRANQRKLLGIIGALAVPIALVVGLYTDSGDLFKGYLTFEANETGESQVTTYLNDTLVNGLTDNTENPAAGFFVDYFSGSAKDASGSVLFNPDTECRATNAEITNTNRQNLADQYGLLENLLADRTNVDNITKFGLVKNFYNQEFTNNRKLLKNTGLATDTNATGFVSYEDIQKTLLVNFMAYKAADCETLDIYHVGYDLSEDFISLAELEERIFTNTLALKEKQIIDITLANSNDNSGNNLVVDHLFVSATENSLGGDTKSLNLLKGEAAVEYEDLQAEKLVIDTFKALNEINFVATVDNADHTARKAELVELQTLINSSTDLNSYITDSEKEYVNAKMDIVDNFLGNNGDLAYYANKSLEELNGFNKEAINTLLTEILGFETITDGITDAALDAYIDALETAETKRKELEQAVTVAEAAAAAAEAGEQEEAALDEAKDKLTAAAEQADQAAESFELSIGEDGGSASLTELAEIQMNLEDTKDSRELLTAAAEVLRIVLSEFSITKQNDSLTDLNTYLETGIQLIPAGGAETAANLNPITVLEGLLEADTDKAALAEYKALLEKAQDSFTPNQGKEDLNNAFIKAAEALNTIVENVEARTQLKIEQVQQANLELDYRAGASDKGGFLDTMVVKSDIEDAIVDYSLIELQPRSGSTNPVTVTSDVIRDIILASSDILAKTNNEEVVPFSEFNSVNRYGVSPVTIGADNVETIDLSELNSEDRNFRGLQEENEIPKRINSNNPLLLLVKVNENGGAGTQEHNFDKNSESENLEAKYVIYHISDKIIKTAELLKNNNPTNSTTTTNNNLNQTTDANFYITTTPTGDLKDKLPKGSNAFSYSLIDEDENVNCNSADHTIVIPATLAANGNITTGNITSKLVEAKAYKICFAIYDDKYENTGMTITFSEPEETDPSQEGQDETTSNITRVISNNVSPTNAQIRIEGTELSTDSDDYTLTLNNQVEYTAEKVTAESDGSEAFVDFGEVLPCPGDNSCPSYKLGYKEEVNQNSQIAIRKLKILSPNNNSTIGNSNPLISFQCLSDYDYNLVLTNKTTNADTTFSDLTCSNNVIEVNVGNDKTLSKGTRYQVAVEMTEGIGTIDGQYESHFFNTSNNFVLSSDQAKSLDFVCGRQIPETQDSNGVTIPGKRNLVIAGRTANCSASNPFPNVGITEGFKLSIGNNPATAVPLQALTNGFAATSIPVPTDTTDKKIYIQIPGESTLVETNSYVTIQDTNSGTDTQERGADIEDLVELSMSNNIEIGEEIDLEIDIPEGLKVHMISVRYSGTEGEDTEDYSGLIFRYCQEDLTDNFDKARTRRQLDRICDKFYEDDILEGPDTLEIEDFDTSRIPAPGYYDVVIDLLVESNNLAASSNTAYAQSVQLEQVQIVIEEAFEAEKNGFHRNLYNRTQGPIVTAGLNVGFQPMTQQIRVNTSQCSSVFADINGTHQICSDIMYLYEKNIYRGIPMQGNIVSGISQPATRANLFVLVDRLMSKNQYNVQIDPSVLYRYKDLTQDIYQNPVNNQWLTSLARLTMYGLVRGDANSNVNPFRVITQAEAAKLVGIATGMITPQMLNGSPWYANIVSKYIAYSMNLNPNAPATLGDVLILMSRSLQIQQNPNLYPVINNTHGVNSAALVLQQQQGQLWY
jgi:hypothetical protein